MNVDLYILVKLEIVVLSGQSLSLSKFTLAKHFYVHGSTFSFF